MSESLNYANLNFSFFIVLDRCITQSLMRLMEGYLIFAKEVGYNYKLSFSSFKLLIVPFILSLHTFK